MKGSFPDLPDQLNEEYVSGKCMYLAAALHRRYGYEIQAAIEDHGSSNAYIGHAWVVEPLSGDVVDIDGQWPSSKNGYLGWPKTKHETGLDEAGLKALVDMTASSPCSAQDWEAAVSDAEQLLARFFIVEAT